MEELSMRLEVGMKVRVVNVDELRDWDTERYDSGGWCYDPSKKIENGDVGVLEKGENEEFQIRFDNGDVSQDLYLELLSEVVEVVEEDIVEENKEECQMENMENGQREATKVEKVIVFSSDGQREELDVTQENQLLFINYIVRGEETSESTMFTSMSQLGLVETIERIVRVLIEDGVPAEVLLGTFIGMLREHGREEL